MHIICISLTSKLNSLARVPERTIPTETLPLVGEVSAKFADRGWNVFSVTDPYGRIFGFLDRSRYFFLQVAPKSYSRGWVDPVPDPPLKKSDNTGNLTWICSQELWLLDHRVNKFKRSTMEQVWFITSGYTESHIRFDESREVLSWNVDPETDHTDSEFSVVFLSLSVK
jgi:hypothetical protein